jgi:nucleoid-associated protein YgaU
MNMARRALAGSALALGDSAVVIGWRPDLAAVAGDVAAPNAWVSRVGPDGAAVTLASAALWCVALWLGVGLVAAVAARLPGAAGRIARGLARVALPGAVYRVAAGAAGLGVLLSPVAAAAVPAGRGVAQTATATGPIPAPTWPVNPPHAVPAMPVPAVPAPTWPNSPARAVPAMPAPSRPATPPPSAAAIPRSAPPPSAAAGPTNSSRDVVVRPGDSLWRISKLRLGPSATPAQTATAWPRWYAANRAVIGADPDLIRPGLVLRPPASAGAAR